MLAIDVSNYSSPISVATLNAWRAAGVGLVIIQAFPPTYVQHTEQRDQMRAAVAAGMPFDCYVYDYLGDPTWLDRALDGLDQAAEKPRRVWLDEEDTETEQGWSHTQREVAINEHLLTVLTRGYDAGLYTAAWWWIRTGGSEQFADHELWAAQYDGIPDATAFVPFGGWSACHIKQYQGTSTFLGVSGVDLNVLSVEEEQELYPPEEPMPDCSGVVNGLAYVADDLGDQLLAEAKRASVRKTVVRNIVKEMERVRVEQVGPRPE